MVDGASVDNSNGISRAYKVTSGELKYSAQVKAKSEGIGGISVDDLHGEGIAPYSRVGSTDQESWIRSSISVLESKLRSGSTGVQDTVNVSSLTALFKEGLDIHVEVTGLVSPVVVLKLRDTTYESRLSNRPPFGSTG